jgi:hypothetical protein
MGKGSVGKEQDSGIFSVVSYSHSKVTAYELNYPLSHRINVYSDFVHRPDYKELEDKKHDILETGSVSVLG